MEHVRVAGPGRHAGHPERHALGAVRQKALDGDRPSLRNAVAHLDRDVDERAPAEQVRADRRLGEFAGAHRTQRDLAVDAAVVEPRPVPALRLHRIGIAPVGAHDEPVRALRLEGDGRLEGQVGADVRGHEPAVEPHRRAVVDRLEAQDVAARAAHAQVALVPGDAAGERARGQRSGVGHVGHGHRAPAEAAARPAPPRAGGRRVRPHAPAGVQRGAVGRPAADPGLRAAGDDGARRCGR